MGEVQSEASEVKEKEKVKASEEPEVSSRELLTVIKKQQEEISDIKEHFNKLVDAFSELGETIEKGAGKGGGLGELAGLIKAIAPLMRGSETNVFTDIGVFTFKQFLRSAMGKKAGKKAIEQMFKEEEKKTKGEEE